MLEDTKADDIQDEIREKQEVSMTLPDMTGIENIEEKFYDEAALEYYEGKSDQEILKKISLNKKKKNKDKDKKEKKKKSKK